MKGLKVVHIPGKFYWYRICSFKFSNVFVLVETVILGCLGGLLAKALQNVVNFLWNFEKWWHAIWCIRYAKVFIEVIRNGQNWTKEWIRFILRVTPSYILWDTRQDFAKWNTLFRYISVVSCVSIAYVVVKLKSFSYWFSIHGLF